MNGTSKANGLKATTTSFKIIISLIFALTGIIASAGTFVYKAGGEKEKMDSHIEVLNRAVAGLRADEVLHKAKYEELVRRVYAIDKNVYGITVQLGMKNAIKPEEN